MSQTSQVNQEPINIPLLILLKEGAITNAERDLELANEFLELIDL